MATTPKKPELIAIVGPTASGKSALAMEVAQLVPCELITADSRTIYKDMNIGTAKPSPIDQKKVPHWGLDLLEPGKSYSAHDFQAYAKTKIEEISRRHHLPLIVGGTGLYIDSVVYDFEFISSNTDIRETLEAKSVQQLHELILAGGLGFPENKLNKRHLIRTIERQGERGTKKPLLEGTIIIGLLPSDKILRANIEKRAEAIFKQGIINETKLLIGRYGRDAIQTTGGIVYKICMRVLDGEISEQTATTLFKNSDWQYARRQKTWFKKNNDIFWFTDKKQALDYLELVLNT